MTISIILLFAAAQLINVILNTMKTLVMAKTDNIHASAAINAVTFGFYTVVVQQISSLPLEMTVPVVIVTNIIGVYLSYIIMKFFHKDRLWKVEVYIANEDAMSSAMSTLKQNSISYSLLAQDILVIYCYNKDHSRLAKEAINAAKAACEVKYNIVTAQQRF